MPAFANGGYSFTRQNIEALSDKLYGVYGLWRNDAWIYVGMGWIRARLLAHLNGDNSCITAQRPQSFGYTVTKTEEEAAKLEKQLILQLNPICNRRVG